MKLTRTLSILLLLFALTGGSAAFADQEGCQLPYFLNIFRTGTVSAGNSALAQQNALPRCQDRWDQLTSDPSFTSCGNFWVTIHGGNNGYYTFNCKYCGSGVGTPADNFSETPISAGGAGDIATAVAAGRILDITFDPGGENSADTWVVGIVDRESGVTRDVVVDADTGDARLVEAPSGADGER